MNFSRILLTFLMLSTTFYMTAQKTMVFKDPNLAFKQGLEFYNQSLFGPAQDAFGQTLSLTETPSANSVIELRQNAELKYAQCAIRLKQPEGERLITDFIRKYASTAIANQARLEMGNFYFATGKFEKALQFYSGTPTSGLSNSEIEELRFKKGYAFFVRKKFRQAKSEFKHIKDISGGKYYQEANYYYGITEFFDNDYDNAIKSFKRVQSSPKYSRVIPYYVSQIHFAKGEYDQLIKYATGELSKGRIKYEKEINQLLGQAYFERKEYRRALPYLEEYVNNARRLRKEDLYQIAYTEYQVGKYKDAIKNFEELNNLKSKLGQNALYNLGDCHIKVGDKVSARSAFKQASTFDFDKSIKEESAFQYAKLSYELRDDKEAIKALRAVPRSSKYYNEAQELLGKAFLNTANYAGALKTLETIPNKSVDLKEAYQKVAYYRGVQLYNDNQIGQAKALFQKSLQNPINNKIKALAHYWVGEINHKAKSYDTSIRDYNTFLTVAKAIPNLPDESSIHTANYAQGYNYLKKEDYVSAGKFFYSAANGIEKNIAFIKNNYVKAQVMPDALLRNADCYLKRNKYDEAQINYNKVINARHSGYDYAMYQKALILGLQNKMTDKIVVLENLAEKNQNSNYADDALLRLGSTYFEIGKPYEATRELKKLVARYKGKSNLINSALLKLGLIAYNQDETDKALDYYKEIFKNNPDSREAKDALAGIEEIYIDRGEPDKYFAFLETVPGYKITTSTKDSLTFKTAENQYSNGQFAQAIKSFDKYLRKYPNGANSLVAYFQRGECHFELKDYGNALIDYEYVVNRGQSNYYAKALRKAAVIAYNFSRSFGKAYSYYEKLEQVSSSTEELYTSQLGAMRSAYRGDNESGVYKFATKVMDSSRSTKKDKAEGNYYIGKMALENKTYPKALPAFNNVMVFINNVWAAEAHYQTAFINFEQNNLEKAQDICLAASSNYPDYDYWLAKSIILLSDIFVKKDDLFNAKYSLESIIENYTGNDEILKTAKDKLAIIKQAEQNGSRIINNLNGGDLEFEEEGGN